MQGFDALNPPFDRLAHPEIEELKAALDIGYFRPGEVIVQEGRPSDFLHVIIKGAVEDRAGDTLQAVLGPKDSFDSRAVVHGAAGENFVAAEETLCHLIPQPIVRSLIRRNPAFAAFFYSEVSRKLDAFAGQQRRRASRPSCGRGCGTPATAPPSSSTGPRRSRTPGHRMRDSDINALFVRDGERVGVVTGMNLSKAVVLRRLPLDTPIRDISHFDVGAVGSDDFIFEALLLMTRHNRRRLAIRSDGAYVGFLEDIDILGLFAGNSQLIPGRIDRARSLDDLRWRRATSRPRSSGSTGRASRSRRSPRSPRTSTRRLFVKLFEMVAPPSIRDNGCLLMMGSEGRGEQTVGPTRTTASCWPARSRRPTCGVSRSLFRRAGRVRFPAVPRQRHGPQPGLVAAGRRLHRPAQSLGAGPRPGCRHEPRHLLRREPP